MFGIEGGVSREDVDVDVDFLTDSLRKTEYSGFCLVSMVGLSVETKLRLGVH